MDTADKKKELLQDASASETEAVPAELTAVEQYIDGLIDSLPEWGQDLFRKRRAMFTVDDDFSLGIAFDEDNVSGLAQVDLVKIILEYFEKVPSPIFSQVNIH